MTEDGALDDELFEHFDHHSPEFAEDPWSVYEELRSRCPVMHSKEHGGFWVASRYQDVARVARDDATFSSEGGVVVPPPEYRVIPIDMDPPEFFPYRRILNPLFSPPAVEKIEPQIRELAVDLIDGFIEEGTCDFVEDFASPLPAITTLGILGFPREEWHDFAFPIHHSVFNTPAEEFDDPATAEKVANSQLRMRARIREVLEERRREPRDDGITSIANAEVEGRRLTDDDIVDTVALILIGGLDTTTSAIGNALIYLSDNPEARRRLIEEPELMPTAVEEFLRYQAPVQGLARTVTRDTELGDEELREGDRVLMLWASANRDEEEFEDPDQVRLDRHPNRHLTFGVGVHRCLGSNLARAEFRIALEEVLARIPDYEIDHEGIVRGHDVGVVYGYTRIPARFEPGLPSTEAS